jgi:hypothetical protein
MGVSDSKAEPIRYQESMVWSQFSAIFANFRRKSAFFLNTNVMINFFLNLALFWAKTPVFSQIFLAKIFKKS